MIVRSRSSSLKNFEVCWMSGFCSNGVINIGDWIPWLSFLDLQGYVKRMKDLHKKLDRFNEFVLEDHQARRAAAHENFVPKDMADMLLVLAENPNLEFKLTRDCIKALLQVYHFKWLTFQNFWGVQF